MKFETEKAYPVLDRTPAVIYSLLQGLDEQWIITNAYCPDIKSNGQAV
jgi:hypothetical protein